MTDRHLPLNNAPRQPDHKTWDRARNVIGNLPWEWIPAPTQTSHDSTRHSGSMVCRINERLPTDMPLETITNILHWAADQKPTVLNSGDTVAVSLSFSTRKEAKTAIDDQFGFDLDLPRPTQRTTVEKFKYTPSGTLSNVVFYRSQHEGNRVYCFVPSPHRPDFVKKELKSKSIDAGNFQKCSLGGASGTRMVIATVSEQTLAHVLAQQDITLHDTHNKAVTALAELPARQSSNNVVGSP